MSPSGESMPARWRALSLFHHWVRSQLERALQAQVGLSVAEYTILDEAGLECAEPLRMQDLAGLAGLSASATTRLIGRLDARGLIRRVPGADDRRCIHCEPTAAGRALLLRARAIHRDTLDGALAAAARDPRLATVLAAFLPSPAGSDQAGGQIELEADHVDGGHGVE